MGNQSSLLLTGMALHLGLPGKRAAAPLTFTPKMLGKLGGFSPLMSSFPKKSPADCSCLGEAFWWHEGFMQQDQDGWLPAGFKLVPPL